MEDKTQKIELKQIEIGVNKRNFYFKKGNTLEYLFPEKNILDSIFWLPLLELDFKTMNRTISENFSDIFPYPLLVRSAVFSEHLYWINLAARWYECLNFESSINLELEKFIKKTEVSQAESHKIKKILFEKYRQKTKEIYERLKNENLLSPKEFISELKKNTIKYDHIITQKEEFILVNAMKFYLRKSN